MANEEHVALLKQGVEAWNAWRRDAYRRGNPLSLRPDLRAAALSGADLIEADLSAANLNKANLGGASLSGADLSGANLGEVNLIRADLIGTNLRGADLRRADRRVANLSGASLGGADLGGARLAETVFRGVNLSKMLDPTPKLANVCRRSCLGRPRGVQASGSPSHETGHFRCREQPIRHSG
jgi:uncharacterized protein YjbI with pentapeptide repeats